MILSLIIHLVCLFILQTHRKLLIWCSNFSDCTTVKLLFLQRHLFIYLFVFLIHEANLFKRTVSSTVHCKRYCYLFPCSFIRLILVSRRGVDVRILYFFTFLFFFFYRLFTYLFITYYTYHSWYGVFTDLFQGVKILTFVKCWRFPSFTVLNFFVFLKCYIKEYHFSRFVFN